MAASTLRMLRWPGGQRVASASEVLMLLVPHLRNITLDVKTGYSHVPCPWRGGDEVSC